jgi:CheY-like chemotaxis protein/anti-sigma regulatory factor (Ser/Thr protein kinase)
MRLEIQPIDLPLIVETAVESVRPAADANGIRIERTITPDVGPVSGDPSRLQQVTWNLLSNAVKFTPRGGRVSIAVARVNSHVEMRVSDTGKGISADFLPHLFERFRQHDSSISRQHGGLGLGLAIVKQLVELHGGRVEASSAGEGHGSTFTVILPIALSYAPPDADAMAATAPALAHRAPGIAPDLQGVRLLIVDDEPDAREVIKRILEQCHAQVEVAATADEALAAMRRCPPNVLVSDIGMPGKDGYQFIRSVRAAGIDIPAAALTAFARPEDQARALAAGYQAHMCKPVEPIELMTVVVELARGGSRAAHQEQRPGQPAS